MNKFIDREASELYKVRFLDLYMIGHKGFIAGGCFKNVFQGVRIKDVDIFFNSESDFSEASIYFKGNEDYIFSYENKNTIAFKNKKTNIRIELVRSQFGTPSEILEKFDFSITKFCYYKNITIADSDLPFNPPSENIEYKCLHHEYFFEHLVIKKLVLEKDILFPVSTFERSYRYNKYGYGLCKESKGNLIEALKTANTDDLSNELYFGLD